MSKTVVVTKTEVISITADFTFTSEGQVITFENKSTAEGTTISAWSWNFGDGSEAVTTEKATHTFPSEKTYTVELTVQDEKGNTNKKSKDVVVKLPIVFSNSNSSSSFMILPTGKVYAWGSNTKGQLGINSTEDKSSPTEVTELLGKNIVNIVAGTSHTLAIDDKGKVYAWGDNSQGQLGLNSTEDKLIPTVVTELDDKNIKTIVAGGNHSLAIDADGKVYAWGDNAKLQLGLGGTATTDKLVPTLVTTTIGSLKIVEVVAGADHTIALDEAGKVYGWGNGAKGQHGAGAGATKATPTAVSGTALANKTVKTIVAGGNHTYAIDSDGAVYVWGDNAKTQLGLGTTGGTSKTTPTATALTNIEKIVAGLDFTVAIDTDGKVYTWGNTEKGQLGNTTLTPNVNTATEVEALTKIGMKSLVVGSGHTLAVDMKGIIYSWGDNTKGQLGLGTEVTENQTAPVAVPAVK